MYDVIAEIYSSKTDMCGNRYHICCITDVASEQRQWFTGFSPENIEHHIRRVWKLSAYVVTIDLSIRAWQSLKKQHKAETDIQDKESYNAKERT